MKAREKSGRKKSCKKMGNKASSKKRILGKVLAHLAELESDDENSEEDEESEREENSENEAEDAITGYIFICEHGGETPAEREQSSSINAMLSTREDDEPRYFIDSACRGANVLKTPVVIDRTITTSKLPTV